MPHTPTLHSGHGTGADAKALHPLAAPDPIDLADVVPDAPDDPASETHSAPGRDPFLVALGDRVRRLRARRGQARKALSLASGVSERHLSNLERGVGNASILVLREICKALGCELVDLVDDKAHHSPEHFLIRDLLEGRSEEQLHRARVALAQLFDDAATHHVRHARIALIGMRGAGKSTLGKLLAEDLSVPFIELNHEIERVAGCSLAEIHNLLGANAYRRYERRALEETIQLYPDAVIATPGGVVSDPASFNLLLAQCFCIWLQASPEEHMGRVIAQGDLRPMAGNREAMEDLKRILAVRSSLYSKADLSLDTSGISLEDAYARLQSEVARIRQEK